MRDRHPSDVPLAAGIAVLPLVTVLCVNLTMSFIVLPRLDVAFWPRSVGAGFPFHRLAASGRS